jgi:LmbE family N-acetylglucosaminyl deacetylase
MRLMKKTLLAIFAHPDDELAAFGTIANHGERGDRVVLAWMTKGTRTSFLKGTDEEKNSVRVAQAEEIARLVSAETRFLDFEDAAVYPSRDASLRVAELVRDVKPNIIVTWNSMWMVGPGHPDHRYTSTIVLDAVSYARFQIPELRFAPHRDPISIYLAPGVPSSPFPLYYVDITGRAEALSEFARVYEKMYGHWEALNLKLASSRMNGMMLGCKFAESFNAVQRGSCETRYLD